jgi:hypothetical protein
MMGVGAPAATSTPPATRLSGDQRAPAQFSSLSDFTDELMALSESLKRRAEGLAAREAALDARERDFEKACARTQQGKDSYVVELEQELAATRSRLQATEAQLARFRRERADVTQRLASTQSWLQDAESKAAQLSDQVRHHEKAASARTDSQRRDRRHGDKRTVALGAFVQVLFDLLESNELVAGKVGAGARRIAAVRLCIHKSNAVALSRCRAVLALSGGLSLLLLLTEVGVAGGAATAAAAASGVCDAPTAAGICQGGSAHFRSLASGP